MTLFAKHGFSLDPKPVINDGVTKTYFLGTEITQSGDRFEVAIGMQGFIEGMVHDLASDTANFVSGWDINEETKQSWEHSRTFAVPMKPNSVLTPPTPEEKLLYNFADRSCTLSYPPAIKPQCFYGCNKRFD